jgi:thiamine-phosphate diphosphorylase
VATNASARVTRTGRAALLRGIYAIVNDGDAVVELAAAALEAGVRIVQYRAKGGVVADRVHRLRVLTRRHDALLILNDDWCAAGDLDCDGAHLGPDDAGFFNVEPIRASFPDLLIGLSCGTSEEIRRANTQDVDYLGIGSIFATGSKSDAGVPIGVQGLCALSAQTALPVAAVGGITLSTLHEVRECGVAMAGVISAICEDPHPARAARALVARWQSP